MEITLTIKTTLQQPAMPLSMAARGQDLVVTQVNGGRTLRQRLMDLGLNQGAHVRILKNDIPGPLIIAVKADGRLALGRGMSHHILVTAVEPDNPPQNNTDGS